MNWITKISRWETTRTIKKHAISDHLWLDATAKLPLIDMLDSVEKAHVRVLATQFLYEKAFSGALGFNVSDEMKVVIAAQACLEIFHLGIHAFDGWREIILYPDAFQVNREAQDESGLVSSQNHALSGEAWDKGPVILSWADVERDSYQLHPGSNVVIHEFAHKLDMLNGRANGMPPLHPDMEMAEWTESLSNAFEDLTESVIHHRAKMNAYATTNPAEFFAVMSEYFFTAPELLFHRYPNVYKQLSRYFRQNTIERFNAH
jgi:Mlc titration factor MtfA (ptsG expression regulator)